jgi:hypothetical protein
MTTSGPYTRVQKYTAAQRKVIGGGSALRVHQPPVGSRPKATSGPALAVRVVTQGELIENGGTIHLQANEPMVMVVEAAPGGKVVAGPAILVYPVTATGAFDATF